MEQRLAPAPLFQLGHDAFDILHKLDRELGRLEIAAGQAPLWHDGVWFVPLAGVPYHALDTYLVRLLSAGLTVAICEQVEDAALATGLVKREVVKVITPGMIVSEELLDKSSNNFLLSLFNSNKKAGLSFLDISIPLSNMNKSDENYLSHV